MLDTWRRAGSERSVTDDAPSLSRLIERDSEALLVAVNGDEIVGTLIAAWDGWRGNMYRLAVSPEHRRRGLARALVDEGERRLHARGARRIAALVLGREDEAIDFWVAAGYQRDERIQRHVRTIR